MKKLYDTLTVLSILLFLGACGGIEKDSMTVASGILLMAVSVFGVYVFARLSDAEEKKRAALHHQERLMDKSSIHSVSGSDPDVNPAEGLNHG